MNSKLSICVLGIWLSSAAFAESWDFYSTTPEQLAPTIRACVIAGDETGDRENCAGLFVEPCVIKRPDFRRCFGIESEAWRIVLDEEFKMTFIEASLHDELSDIQRPNFRRRAETVCRAQVKWQDFLDAEGNSQRAVSGAGTIGRDYAAAFYHNEISNRALSLRQTRALTLARADADLEVHRDRVGLSPSELRDIYGSWCDLETGEIK
ncbi:hypothetical protein [Roseovarius rhodophyticola]|uniref:DUF1311 domain-containing protein n=1 Tax=Roseovarius rhodophyticola TaxID=3080827 RepID=A0ABZ2TEG8_9RHOB|nr:hypothetical protein [Roseovarius sp. W115]MDV2931424.1 hypothetical protein [Roseovarius sp. W115]